MGQRIKEAREKKGIKQKDLANALNVNVATVSKYEKGLIPNIKDDTLAKIAAFLDVHPAYLRGWNHDLTKDLISSNTYTYIPVKVSAGLPMDVEPLTRNDFDQLELPNVVMGKWSNQKDIFIMNVNGDSMNKIIPDDSLIAVKPISIDNLQDNDIVVFSNHHEYSVKRFYNDKENQQFIFRPESYSLSFTDYIVPYHDASKLIIHGKVVVYINSLD